MENNDALISAIDAMGTIATITGFLCFAIGLGVGLMEQRLTPIILGIFLCLSFAFAPDVMKAVAGIEEPPEQVQMLDDGKATEKGDDVDAESNSLMLALPWLIAVPIVLLVSTKVHHDISVQAEAYSEAETSQNQSPNPPEEIVLPNTQPEPELQTMSSSVGSLKSTRKIQLD